MSEDTEQASGCLFLDTILADYTVSVTVAGKPKFGDTVEIKNALELLDLSDIPGEMPMTVRRVEVTRQASSVHLVLVADMANTSRATAYMHVVSRAESALQVADIKEIHAVSVTVETIP